MGRSASTSSTTAATTPTRGTNGSTAWRPRSLDLVGASSYLWHWKHGVFPARGRVRRTASAPGG
jgi:hypothetical protein